MQLNSEEIDRVEQALEILTVRQLEEALRIAEWGRWAGSPYAQIGYPPCMIAMQKSGPPPEISDDEALVLDRAIAELEDREKAVIKILYWHCKPTVLAAKKLNTSRQRVRSLRLRALQQLHARVGFKAV